MVNLKPIQIYTDGACRGNPGKGGWGCVINDNGVESEMRGYVPQTTNNRMELIAVIEVLKSISQERELIIFTDSKYVMDGITVWINNWKKQTKLQKLKHLKLMLKNKLKYILKKWKPNFKGERASCGQNLYVQGFSNGTRSWVYR